MQDLEYIDNYFKGALPAEETGRFEQRILSDTAFAEAVSFYCASVLASREQLLPEKKQRFRELYQKYNPPPGHRSPSLVRRLMPYAAAAAILAVAVLCWFMFLKPVTPQQMAGRYEQQQFTTFDVTMSSRGDSLQQALRLYNEGRPGQALQQFESMISKNDSDITARKYAGIVSLQLGEYDKALEHFRQLQQYKGLYSNPGKFLYALTLMKRSMPGDNAEAKQLLQQVVQNDLEGKETAQQWLSKW